MSTDLARDLRSENAACDPMPFAMELGLIDGKGSFLRQAGGGLLVRCVSHGPERTPSMSITRGPDGTIRVKCFGCDFTADAISLIRQVRGCGHREACAELARIVGRWDVVDELEGRGARRERPAQRPAPAPAPGPTVDPELRHRVYSGLAEICGPLSAHRDVLAYVTARAVRADAEACGCFGLPRSGDEQVLVIEQLGRAGILRQDLVDVGLMVAGDELRFVHPENRLCIPWLSADGRISVIQRRRLDGQKQIKYVFPKDASPAEPFGADVLGEARAFLGGDPPIVVTEGAIDCFSRRKIARLSDERVVVIGVPSARMARPEWSAVFDGRHVIVAFDPDDAGDRGAEHFAETCLSGARTVERERSRFGDWNETLRHALKGDA